MNTENLHELINRYENNIDTLYNTEHDELFKWRATKVWRDEWFKPDNAFANFADRYTAAKREFSLFIDNSRMHPSSGVIKLWEKEPEMVEHLFRDILFADAHGNVNAVQDNMDRFLEEYENLRQKYFPRNWSFKMDRHSASVFIAMTDPDFNYVFKASEAQAMAKYTDFGSGIGSGIDFNLSHYYKLCEEVVAALKEHQSLLEKHFARLTDEFYQDKTLHLLAFDLMYCSRAYNFYRGLIVPSTRRITRKKNGAPELTPEEIARREEKRLTRIDEIEQEITELEISCSEYADISLIGVQVTANIYGEGTVIAQEINKIIVKFADTEKTFILDKKYLSRPRFENDEVIVEAFTEYGQKQEQIKRLERELATLQ
jgi:hypothetical protein